LRSNAFVNGPLLQHTSEPCRSKNWLLREWAFRVFSMRKEIMASRGEFIRRLFLITLTCLICAGFPASAKADKPYFVTYDDQMEEQGNLELAFNPVVGLPQKNRAFV